MLRGQINITKSGKICQRWDKGVDGHGRPTLYQDQEENYCRTLAGDGVVEPWCYTTDNNTRWEECDVPICSKFFSFKWGKLADALVLAIPPTIFHLDHGRHIYFYHGRHIHF